MEGEAIGGEPGIEEVGEDIGDDDTSAQAAVPSGKYAPAAFVHELFPDVVPSLSSSGVVEVIGLGLDDGAFAMTERGGSMLKILSSAGGGP